MTSRQRWEALDRLDRRVVAELTVNLTRSRCRSDPRTRSTLVLDVAVHSVEKASDIVDNAVAIIRGAVAEWISGIVQNSADIGTHAVGKLKEILMGNGAEVDAEA